MPDASSYSPDYVAARARFRAAAYALDAHVEHHPLDALGPDGEDLSIDVARLGRMDARRETEIRVHAKKNTSVRRDAGSMLGMSRPTLPSTSTTDLDFILIYCAFF